MKLQSLGVIFVLIILPIILVLTYYVQLQVDTVELQTQYDSKLLDSTYDAMSSFEINTANEDLSTVSDSLRTIIEASTNTFFNTLATNLGMSNANKSAIEPYIPAILYTLYDGYYIYSPTKTADFIKTENGTPAIVGEPGVSYLGGGKFEYKEPPKEGDDFDKYQRELAQYENDVITYDDLHADNHEELYGSVITTNKYKNQSILKSYIPYSARYHQVNDDNIMDVTCVYTLDNFVSIEGTIVSGDVNSDSRKEQYYTKSGYLVGKDSVKVTFDTNKDITNYSQEDAKRIIESGNHNVEVVINEDAETVFKYESDNQFNKAFRSSNAKIDAINRINNGIEKSTMAIKLRPETKQEYINADNAFTATLEVINKAGIDLNTIFDIDAETKNALQVSLKDYYAPIDDPEGDPDKDNTKINNKDFNIQVLNAKIKIFSQIKNRIQYELDIMSAATYYSQAQIFSKWVSNTFGTLRENSLIQISGQDYSSIQGIEEITHDFKAKGPNDFVFDIRGDKLKIDDNSNFYRHKTAVIRDSIQYNLNLAMSTYNLNSIKGYEYSMPVLSTEEWNQIINNISIVTFMQGFRCGLSTYNNYKVVSSTNNEFMPVEENIYFTQVDNFDDLNGIAHRINCPKLINYDLAHKNDNVKYLAFSSKDLKYDKIFDKNSLALPYKYDHRNYSCYQCIVDGNHPGIDIFDNNPVKPEEGITQEEKDKRFKDTKNLRRAYYIGIGKERNNTYKMNAFEISEGYEFIYSNFQVSDDKIVNFEHDSSRPIKDIKAVEVIVGTLYATDRNETTLSFRISVGGAGDANLVNDEVYSVTANSLNNNTMYITFDPEKPVAKKTNALNKATLHFNIQNQNSTLSNKAEGADNTDKDAIFKSCIKSIRVFYK